MKANLIQIKELCGIKELEIRPGESQFIAIEGANGTGKSSVIRALLSAFNGGNQAHLLRKGAKEGELVIEFDDGARLRERVTAESTTTNVSDPRVGRVGKVRTYLDRLTDSLGVNPVELLMTRREARGQKVLEALPMSVSLEELRQAVGVELPEGIEDGHALEAIARARTILFNRRTEENRVVRDKEVATRELAETLPAEEFDPYKLAEELTAVDHRLAEVSARLRDLEKAVERRYREEEAKIDRKKADELAQAKERHAAELAAITQAATTAKDEAAAEIGGKVKAEVEELSPRELELREKRGGLVTRLDRVRLEVRQREILARQEAALETARARAAELEAGMDALDTLAAKKASELPIEGVEIGPDGALYVDGLDFEHQLNTAEQVKFAARLARIRSKDLGLILIDGLERLDDEQYRAFEEWARDEENRDVTFIVTRVTEGPFRVRTEPQEVD